MDTKKKEKKDMSQADDKKNEVQKHTEPEIKLSFYTGTGLMTPITAAFAAMMSMIMLAKPCSYALSARAGGNNEPELLDIVEAFVFLEKNEEKMFGLSLAVAVLTMLAAVGTLILIIRMLRPERKPLVSISIGAFVCQAAALGIHIYSRCFAFDLIDLYTDLSNGLFEAEAKLGVYDVCLAALIINTLMLLVMIFGMISGRKKWNKEKKAY